MMELLLDSHTLLWLVFEITRLPLRVRLLLEDPQSRLFVSAATLWELTVKISRGRIDIPELTPEYLLEQVALLNIGILPVQLTDILRVAQLPHIHREPFDRMLIAQATEREMTLLTADAEMQLYPVRWIWK